MTKGIKRILLVLHLGGTSGRELLSGIFSFIKPKMHWQTRILADLGLLSAVERVNSFIFVSAEADTYWSDERKRGFQMGLREVGKACSVVQTASNEENDIDMKRLAAALAAAPKPCAVFAAWDGKAIQVSNVCSEQGLEVPTQVAILGVDNVRRAIRYIDQHAMEGITARDVVAYLGVSRRLADLRIRQIEHTSLGKLIAERKLKAVAENLIQTDLPLQRIAAECGFTSNKHLQRAFKARFCQSMTAYRAARRHDGHRVV